MIQYGLYSLCTNRAPAAAAAGTTAAAAAAAGAGATNDGYTEHINSKFLILQFVRIHYICTIQYAVSYKQVTGDVVNTFKKNTDLENTEKNCEHTQLPRAENIHITIYT